MASYFFVVLIGGLVGVAELITRYRDEPLRLFEVPSAWFYILLNSGASAGVLSLAHTYDWRFGEEEPRIIAISQIVWCGVGAMVLLRSHVFNVKIDGKEVPVGPSAMVTALLFAADRGVDRRRAVTRSQQAEQLMSDVSFEAARRALAVYSLSMLQNASPQEQKELSEAVDALGRSDLTDKQKSMNLGLILINLVGSHGLKELVRAHRDEITRPPQED